MNASFVVGDVLIRVHEDGAIAMYTRDEGGGHGAALTLDEQQARDLAGMLLHAAWCSRSIPDPTAEQVKRLRVELAVARSDLRECSSAVETLRRKLGQEVDAR